MEVAECMKNVKRSNWGRPQEEQEEGQEEAKEEEEEQQPKNIKKA